MRKFFEGLDFSGTRIYYDRAFLLSRRDSPMTRSPPHLPFIPEGMLPIFLNKRTTKSIRFDFSLSFAVTLIPEPSKTGSSVGTVVNGTHPETTNAPSAGHLNVSGVEPTAQATTHKKGQHDFSPRNAKQTVKCFLFRFFPLQRVTINFQWKCDSRLQFRLLLYNKNEIINSKHNYELIP